MANKTTQVIEVVTKGAKKSEKQLKGVSGGLKSMAKSAALAAGAYLGARGLISAIKSSLTLYAEQQLAEVKLESALGKTSATLKKYASALQQTTRFGDELILQGMAQLAFFIKDEKQLKIATKATLDLASAKGMDLVQAADLVAKSVGSSTNALSRYGIAAEGAVGSEERLLSITDEIANLFGGQAEATTDSYQGAIDQLSNSFGDMQERIGQALAPTIQALAENFTDLLSVPVSEQLQNEKDDFNNLADALINVNTSASTRKTIISDLQTLYPEYIGNLDLEKASIEDIKKATEDANKAMQDKITTQVFAEELAEVNAKIKKEEVRLFELETKGVHESSGGWRSLFDIWKNAPSLGWVSGSVADLQDILEPAQESRIQGLEDEKKAIEKNKEEFLEWLGVRSGDPVDPVDSDDDPLTVFGPEQDEAFILYEEAMRKKMELDAEAIAQDEDNIRVREKWIDKYSEEAAGLGMLNDADLKRAKLKKKLLAGFKEGVISETITNTISSANALYKQYVSTYPPPTGQILGGIAYAGTLAKGYSDVKSIKKAQYGADFVTDGPQMMMVGEGSGPEHVQVTPLVDENQSGPQGAGATINISGNVMTDEFVESHLIEKIREATRMGENLGA